jgi:hypothetical protein
MTPATALTMERARSLYRDAREHKRLSNQHRQLNKAKMAELERFCRQHGIQFHLITEREGEFHGGSDSGLPA